MNLLLRRREMMGGKESISDDYIYYQVYVSAANVDRAIWQGLLSAIKEMWFEGEQITPIGSKIFESAGTYNMKVLLYDATTIPNNALNAAHFRNAILPACVTSIGLNAFRNYELAAGGALTILATTPPTLDGDPFGNRHNIAVYVPAESVSAYQAAWTNVTNIQAIQ